MPDYAPPFGKPQSLTYLAGAAITGGQALVFSAADTVVPSSAASLAFAGIAAHDASTGAAVTALAGAGLVHETASTLLGPPAAPAVTPAASGGTVAAGNYQVSITYVNGQGESLPSATVQVTATTSLATLSIASPSAPAAGATGWYAYVSQAGAAPQTRQQTAGSPTAIGTPLVITAPPTSSGLAPNTVNMTGAAAGNLLALGPSGLVAPGAAAGSEVGVVIRPPNAAGLLRWKSTRG